MNIPRYALAAAARLDENGYEVFFVGGCVRDMVMGIKPHDYDLATNALPEEIKKCFPDFTTVLTGEKHGTVCVVSEGENIEITTYRNDGEYSDFRHPETVSFTNSLEKDLSRRDFTVNAMAYSEKTGLVDPFGGREDIGRKIIRCVGVPEKRFGEDALRILRALRFSARFGFKIEQKTAAAIREMKELILKVSAERIFSELCGIITAEHAEKLLLDFPEVITVVLPELSASVGFEQKNIHHCYDVYTHTAKVVSGCPPDTALRLAALFHDCGKPSCFFMGDDGQGHFYGHASAGAELAGEALTRLKSPNKIKSLVCELVKLHDREIVNTRRAVKRFMRAASREAAERIFALKKADNLALAPEYHSRTELIRETENTMKSIVENQECFSLKQLCINGNTLIENGFEPSRQLGEILSALLDAVIDGRAANEKEDLLRLAQELRAQGTHPQVQSPE
ncbi:MAG: HD domain-containing protein [Clostridia bacterium]|nr:HD domain-containing protein [Clostridia bacterium]